MPRAGQASGELDPEGNATSAAGPRSSVSATELRRIESGASRGRRRWQRIGSVLCVLGTWAASAGSARSKTSVTGAAANPSVGGRACVTRESWRDRVPHRDPLVVLALLRLSSANSSPRRAEVGSTAVHDRHLRANRLMFFAILIVDLTLRVRKLHAEREVYDAKKRFASNACCLRSR